jgi:endonuclease YncB( thermonuclease family)
MLKQALGLAFAIIMGSTASAETIAGQASVIDGDTIDIHGERIRILDIDAPELDQTCSVRAGGDTWPCGQRAAHALSEWISRYSVTCETAGTDNAGRWLAHCNVAAVSIATWMDGNGWAMPNQDCQCGKVRNASAHAEQANAGIWGGESQMPWEWRKSRAR